MIDLGATWVATTRVVTASLFLGMAAVTASAQSSSTATVLPTGYEQREGETLCFWAFTPFPSQRQLLVDESVLTALKGRTLREIEVRRDGGRAVHAGGKIFVEIRVSHSPLRAIGARGAFAENRGKDEVVFFRGTIDLPASPAPEADPAPWQAPSSVRILGATPFVMLGGTLCIETRTKAPAATSAASAPFWPVDAMRGPVGASSVQGISCLPGPGALPASADAASSVVGGLVQFSLQTPPMHPPFAFFLWGLNDQWFGTFPLPMDLTALGAPGCFLRQEILGIEPVRCERPAKAAFELARIAFPIPMQPRLAGLQLFGQWLRLPAASTSHAFALSNGTAVKLGAVPRDFAFAYVRSDDASARDGEVERARIPILRLHHDKD